MQRINQPLQKEYSPIKLYVEELFRIEEILESAGGKLKIKTKEHEFDNIQELFNLQKDREINHIDLSIYNPYISVDLGKNSVRLYANSDDVTSMGIFAQLDKVLSSLRRKPSLFIPLILLGLLTLL